MVAHGSQHMQHWMMHGCNHTMVCLHTQESQWSVLHLVHTQRNWSFDIFFSPSAVLHRRMGMQSFDKSTRVSLCGVLAVCVMELVLLGVVEEEALVLTAQVRACRCGSGCATRRSWTTGRC